MGREVVIADTEGKLHFGTWEQIFYGEFDAIGEKGYSSKSSESKTGFIRISSTPLGSGSSMDIEVE